MVNVYYLKKWIYFHINCPNCFNFLEDNDICFYLSIDINSTYDYTVAINGRFNI
jgi:hypothetical protein